MNKPARAIAVIFLICWLLIAAAQPAVSDAEQPTMPTGQGVSMLIAAFDNSQPLASIWFPVLSADGRYVAYSTYSDYLGAGDNNGFSDVYLFDRETLETMLVSRAMGGAPTDNHSSLPQISEDGRYIAYYSRSSNIVSNDDNETYDIFIFDRVNGVTDLVSRKLDGQAAGSNDGPVISDNGLVVAFGSPYANLVENDTNQIPDIFVLDRGTNKIELVSVSTSGEQSNNYNWLYAISGDGQHILFSSSATNLVEGAGPGSDLFIHDRVSKTTTVAYYDMDGNPVEDEGHSIHNVRRRMSFDGRYVVIMSKNSRIVENDTNDVADIFILDVEDGWAKRVSVTSGGNENHYPSSFPNISSDGKHVSFTTYGALVPEDTNNAQDVYAFDIETGELELLSIGFNGQQLSHAAASTLSGDGRVALFQPNDFAMLRIRDGGTIPLHTPLVEPINNSDEDGSFVVRWSNVVNALQYEVHEIGITGTSQQVYSGSERSYMVTDKGYGTWCYKVRALGPNGSQSEWSTLSCIEIPPCVPYFSQKDPRWAGHPLRTDGSCSASCNTIGACGCTLTAATMLFSYYGADLTPNTLSDAMGIKACPFYWGVGATATGGKAINPSKVGFTWSQLERELNHNGRHVILGMSKGSNTHWVLVTSGQGTDPADYLIHDPWPENGPDTSLDVYRKQGWTFNSLVTYDGVGVCRPSPTTVMHINLVNNGQRRPEPNAASIGSAALRWENEVEQGPITGSISVYHLNVDTAVVQLRATSENASITEMQVWTDSQTTPLWQPYDILAWIPWEAGDDTIYARFRDKDGNISQTFQDSMWPLIGPPSETENQALYLLPVILNR